MVQANQSATKDCVAAASADQERANVSRQLAGGGVGTSDPIGLRGCDLKIRQFARSRPLRRSQSHIRVALSLAACTLLKMNRSLEGPYPASMGRTLFASPLDVVPVTASDPILPGELCHESRT